MRERTRAILAQGRRLGRRVALPLNGVLRRRSPWLGAALLVAAVPLIVWWGWRWVTSYVGPSTPPERTSLLQAIAQIVGGAILLLGLYFTARNLQVNREGQITERFTRAIDQLGSDRLEVRLGGIYALERIARDSARDHQTVMEVLTAFVRERSPWPPADPAHKVITYSGVDPAVRTPPLQTDVQAALTVIGRRTRWFGHGEDRPLELSRTDLRSYDLSESHLEGALFHLSNLDDARLFRARLDNARIFSTSMRGARMWEASLKGAWLIYVDLSQAVGVEPSALAEATRLERTIPPAVNSEPGEEDAGGPGQAIR